MKDGEQSGQSESGLVAKRNVILANESDRGYV
jgi:hypothetical protein